jgi:hypothetical protein
MEKISSWKEGISEFICIFVAISIRRLNQSLYLAFQ